MSTTTLAGETTELLQGLIRNQCVNDGTASSGNEQKSAAMLHDYLGSGGLAVERHGCGVDELREQAPQEYGRSLDVHL